MENIEKNQSSDKREDFEERKAIKERLDVLFKRFNYKPSDSDWFMINRIASDVITDEKNLNAAVDSKIEKSPEDVSLEKLWKKIPLIGHAGAPENGYETFVRFLNRRFGIVDVENFLTKNTEQEIGAALNGWREKEEML